jgi:hypothetical protein
VLGNGGVHFVGEDLTNATFYEFFGGPHKRMRHDWTNVPGEHVLSVDLEVQNLCSRSVMAQFTSASAATCNSLSAAYPETASPVFDKV